MRTSKGRGKKMSIIKGNLASKGIAIGKVFIYQPFSASVKEHYFPDEQLEHQLEEYARTVEKTEQELKQIKTELEKSDPDKAAIFSAHIEILRDDAMCEEIEESIRMEHCAPDFAIARVYDAYAEMLEGVDDPLIRERAADLRDVCRRLVRNWHGCEEKNLSSLAEPVIVAARDLLPSDTATMDRKKVLAIITEIGGTTSHSAIIARSYGIPALFGISDLMNTVCHGQEIAVDAIDGKLIIDPTEEERKALLKIRDAHMRRTEESQKFMNEQAMTKDGVRVEIGLNIGSADPNALKGEKHTDFVGLFRTEFLYMEKSSLPDEEEQFTVYKKVLETCTPRPVTIRTLDIGGDKTLECLDLPKEENPFLGNRALRLCFDRKDLFKTQLRALLRASVYGNLWLMLPMVGSMDDIRRAKKIIEETKHELDTQSIPYSHDMKVGIMIEIPSIALMADIAAKEVDFASIGTNDLCQYITATDRMNPAVTEYYQSFHPAIFRLIGQVVQAFAEEEKPLSVCGEMGGDELAVAALIGLGLRKLSMGIHSVACIKHLLSTLGIKKAEELAANIKNMTTASEVESYLKTNLSLASTPIK